MLTLIIIVFLILAIGGLPAWGYHRYGYGPSGGAGLIVLILVVLLLMGYL